MAPPVSIDGILLATGWEAADTITRDTELLRLAPVQLAATGRVVGPKADRTRAVLHAQINTLAKDTYIPWFAVNALAAAVAHISPDDDVRRADRQRDTGLVNTDTSSGAGSVRRAAVVDIRANIKWNAEVVDA